MNPQEYIIAMKGADQHITQGIRNHLKRSIEESIRYERNKHGWINAGDHLLSQFFDTPRILPKIYIEEDIKIKEIFTIIDRMNYNELIEIAVKQEFYLDPLNAFKHAM